MEGLEKRKLSVQLIFSGIFLKTRVDVKIVTVYEIIKLTENKVVYFGIFKSAEASPSQAML